MSKKFHELMEIGCIVKLKESEKDREGKIFFRLLSLLYLF